MFPSSGLFAAVECPFSNNGLCDRPHCLYKHTTSMVGFAGAQNVTPKGDTGTTESDRGKDVCLQELEWINKEIETMRHQVEQEQKQLSNYQTKPITKIPGPLLSKPGNCAEQVEKNSSSQTQTKLAESSESNQYLEKDNGRVIVIDSTSEDEINYSDIDVSDSDPMEECYRIFMEENEQKRTEELPDARVKNMEVEKVELKVKPQELVGKKRVAHEAKHSEPPAKSRPQPQVLIPLRGPEVSGFSSQPAVTSNIQQAQERASMLTASAKGAQAFLSFAGQRKPYASNAPPPLPQCPTSQAQLAPVQNAYVNYIPLGTAVIEVGNNLHLILPDSTFPVTSSSIPVTPVLTPISSMHTSMVTVKQSCPFPAIGPLQRTRSTAPILIPALARKSLTPSLAATHSGAAAPVSASAATAVKPPPHKRKVKHCESTKDKVPHDVRQRYVNMFTEEFLKTTANVNEAFEKALAEERSVYNRSVNKLKYLSVAVNALKKLKNQCVAAAKDANEGNSQQLRGNVPLNLKRCLGNYDLALYDDMKEYMLSVEKLIENNFPVRHPEKPGCAILFVDNKKGTGDPLKRICCRCGATYSVSPTGKHTRKEECTYHYVPGGVETRYSCCEGVMGTPGCQVYKCYTIHGLELSRVTLVNSRLQVIYDTFVRPDNEVIDYNTRFSGISEEDVKGNHTSLREVQDKLLSFINADTILIGHSLETDLCALKLLHGTVVDTSVVFPHHLGPPYKLTLTSITAEHLRRIIQESVCGHDTAEDASACMELMLWKLKEDGKLKK
ncbi:RNA exonuclease 1 -like protein [Takifugu flavidus]|uniref:RNA exonuclease 1-like protein n=1 Tax=Takifugu flavidus TaxID=433684 RepID=A0A5C6MZF4_9TELE|nr:RNA exonuclease 1 -like protein [Takifugu flavidus]